MYDYVVIGGGPTGIAVVTMLREMREKGFKIALLEKASTLGGCWRVEWTSEGLYSEHAPRVMTTTYNRFRRLLKHYGVKFDYDEVYKNSFGIYKKIFAKLSPNDIFKILSGFILSRFIESKDTVEDFMEHLSGSGAEAMYILSVTLANVPRKVMIQDIFDEMYKYHGSFVQLKDPHWYETIQKELQKTVDVRTGCEAYYVTKTEIGNFVVECSKGSFQTREVILALPPSPLISILSKSDAAIRDSWGKIEKLDEFSSESTYHSIGFQIHFSEFVRFPDEWCKFCELDWNMIVLPVSNYLNEYSKVDQIKTVWSGCIIDQDKYSTALKKKVHECSMEEIETEVIRQLKLTDVSKRFTFTSGLTRSTSGYYESKDTGFIRGKDGTLPFEGNADKIYLVGPVNHKGVVTMESALEEACKFMKYKFKDPNSCRLLEPKHKLLTFRNLLLGFVFIIILNEIMKK